MARMSCSHLRLVALLGLLGLSLAAAGCATTAARQSYSVPELVSASINSYDDLRFFPEQKTDLMVALGWDKSAGGQPPPVSGGRFDILVLSSGGPDGSYGAGVLNGLSAAGKRPQYEIVSGVSTGALIAPFAFVGPQYDGLIQRLYTNGDLGRILGRPSMFAAVSGPALFPASGIPDFMNRYVNETLLASIAAEHAKGRRLLIATANLDANQLTVWNMGRIAQIGGPDALKLFHSIIRAAIAIPGAIAPVEIASSVEGRAIREYHGDAGVLSYYYVETGLVPAAYRNPRNGERPRIDIVLHNQIRARPEPVKPRVISLAGKSVASLTRTSMRLLLDRTIANADRDRIELRYTYVPTDWETVSAVDFDTDYMRRTFALGRSRAMGGELWHTGPRPE